MEGAYKWRGAVVGHSYVRRLQQNLRSFGVSPISTLKVGEFCEALIFWGKSGGGLHDVVTLFNDLPFWTAQKIDFVILQCASNDLTKYSSGDFLANLLFDSVKDFLGKNVCKVAIIMLMLPRTKNLGMHTKISFNIEKSNFNKKIKSLCQTNKVINYVKFPTVDDDCTSTDGWSTDGIHPNTELGLTLHRKSLTTAVRYACGILKSL